MSRIYIDILGGGWITASGTGCLGEMTPFSMPPGSLAKLHRSLFSTEPDARWGRMDNYSKAGLIGAALALKDAGLKAGDLQTDTAVIVSTAAGSMEVDHHYFETVLPDKGLLASPNLFAYTLPNCLLGEISIRYGFTGPAIVVSQDAADMLNGILAGAQCLYAGLAERAVAGYCNTEYGLDDEGEHRPGAVFVVMQKSEKQTPLVFDGAALCYNGHRISTLVNCMQLIARHSAGIQK